MGREYERKYRGDAAVIQAIQEKYAPFTPITMETTDYDTPDLKLRLRHWTLRKRLENGVSVCTVKIPLPDGSRSCILRFRTVMSEGPPDKSRSPCVMTGTKAEATGSVLPCRHA